MFSPEIKRYFGSNATGRDVYLAYYIMMYIFYEFYSGKNRDPKKTDFIQVSHLINHLDERFERLYSLRRHSADEELVGAKENQGNRSRFELNPNRFDLGKMNREEIGKLEEEYSVNLASCVELWMNLLVDHESKRRTKTRIIESVVSILEDHRLAYMVENQIRTTKKLDVLMRQYYLNADRVKLISEAFERGEL